MQTIPYKTLPTLTVSGIYTQKLSNLPMFRRTLLLEELQFGFLLSFGGILYQCYSFLQQIQWKDLYVVQQLPRHAWIFLYPQWRQFIPRELIMCHAVLFFLQFPLLLFFFFLIPRHFICLYKVKKKKTPKTVVIRYYTNLQLGQSNTIISPRCHNPISKFVEIRRSHTLHVALSYGPLQTSECLGWFLHV